MANANVKRRAAKRGLIRNIIGWILYIIGWILSVLVAVLFVMAGGPKLIGDPYMVKEFNQIGVGQWFRYLTGILEVVGALGVLVPRFSRWAALLLSTVMVGAIIAHLTVLHSEPTLPAVLLVLTLIIAWLRHIVRSQGNWVLLPFAPLTILDWLKTTLLQENDMKMSRPTLGFAIGVIPTIAFILHDLVFQLPDNQHEPTLGFFISVGGLLAIWGLVGYLAGGRREALGAAIKAGALAGITSAGILFLVFVALNNLFVDRMSYEPDRIRAFQQSGFQTMRAYVNHSLLIGPFWPMVMSVATAVSAIGGVIGGIGRYTRVLGNQ